MQYSTRQGWRTMCWWYRVVTQRASVLGGERCRQRTCDDLDAVLVLLDEAAHRQPEAVLLPVLQGER